MVGTFGPVGPTGPTGLAGLAELAGLVELADPTGQRAVVDVEVGQGDRTVDRRWVRWAREPHWLGASPAETYRHSVSKTWRPGSLAS